MAANFQTVVVQRQWMDAETFVMTCQRPEGYVFRSGQYSSIGLDPLEVRDYTLISGEDETELRFLIKRIDGGKVSPQLAEAPLPLAIVLSAAKGYLTYRASDWPAIFVATGVGIAPFLSMIAGGVRGYTMVHGARTAAGLFFQDRLRASADRYVACLSGPKQVDSRRPDIFPGRVTAWMEHHLSFGRYDFYLCGSRAMITDMQLLIDRVYPESRVYSEAFA